MPIFSRKPAPADSVTPPARRVATPASPAPAPTVVQLAVGKLAKAAVGGKSEASHQAPASPQAPLAKAEEAFGGVRFATMQIETAAELSKALTFHEVVNTSLKMAAHFYARFAIAQQVPNSKECVMFVDRAKVTADDVEAVAGLLTKQGWSLARTGAQGYWANPSLVMALSQGHLTASGLKVERDISRDASKTALMDSFTNIVAWSYAQNADDIDFAVDLTSSSSQVAFKIGGRYVRPARFLLPTTTLVQMLGIAWQKIGGGASAQFEVKSEQQGKLELDLVKSDTIPNGARVRLRWSGMSNDKGTVVTLRLQRLGDSARVRSLSAAGYVPSQLAILNRCMSSEGGMIVFAGVVGSGKSTSLAQMLSVLPAHIKALSIEDPVELEIPRMYQKTVTRDLTSTAADPGFISAVRAVFRSALDVLYLGEIRDRETGMVARTVVESGHSVYTTTHAKSCLGVVDRFASPAVDIPRSVLATPEILKVMVYQALLPVNCPHCAKSPADFASAFSLAGAELQAHQRYFDRLERLYRIDASKFRLRDPDGCTHCRKADLPELNGLAGRTVVAEMVEPDEQMLHFIHNAQNVDLLRYWRSLGSDSFEDENLIGKSAMECAVYKSSLGAIDPREIEPRFMAFETVEAKGIHLRKH